MHPVPNPRVLYAKIPGRAGLPVIGEHLVYDPSPTIDLDAPLNGGFLTKAILLSPEPYMRERLRDPSIASYSTPMKVGHPLTSLGIVLVLRSEKDGVNAGDYMFGLTTWETYTVQPYVGARVEYKNYPAYTVDVDSILLQRIQDPKGAFPWSRLCGCLGTPGISAFVGLERCGDAKPGETIYVSAGASGVGSMIIQLSKLKGLRVIASASTDAKVEYMHSLGADIAFNYKTLPVAEALEQHGPLDIYFDNVGGEQLEIAMENMNVNGRIIACGSISEYNTPREERHGIKNTALIFQRRLRISGFIATDAPALMARFMEEFPPLVAQGKIFSQEEVFVGLENAPRAFLSLFNGRSTGKPVVVLDPAYA
ncbi:Zinc-type alcohol dehydrogenase-like protein PB24D3.08c [Mycena kentingensis (nom. inval.)]|nr:Zinc-type alcohol dehydrogenase-like protein PB24D3.08c [Mycena kentingensis (nom. inval.)]